VRIISWSHLLGTNQSTLALGETAAVDEVESEESVAIIPNFVGPYLPFIFSLFLLRLRWRIASS